MSMKATRMCALVVVLFFAACGDGARDDMVRVPAGEFMMGCNEEVDDDCNPAEYPYRVVRVRAFQIDELPAAVARYGRCVDDGSCQPPATGGYCDYGAAGRDDHPINCISWSQARDYCEWEGKRLCSEAEREKAARGTDGRKYPWGNEPVTCYRAVFNEQGEPGAGSGCMMD